MKPNKANGGLAFKTFENVLGRMDCSQSIGNTNHLFPKPVIENFAIVGCLVIFSLVIEHMVQVSRDEGKNKIDSVSPLINGYNLDDVLMSLL